MPSVNRAKSRESAAGSSATMNRPVAPRQTTPRSSERQGRIAMSSRRSVGVSSSMGLSGFVFLWALALACALQVSPALAAGATTPANPFDASVRPLRIGDRVPSAQYVDQDARPVTISQFSGKTLIVGFIYTNCNDQCPILTGK